MKRALNLKELKEAVRLLQETDWSFREIAEIFGCHSSLISNINQNQRDYVADVYEGPFPIRREKLNEKEIQEVVKYYAECSDFNKTIKFFRIKPHRLSRIIRENGPIIKEYKKNN